jgi:glycosyltransferase involved in cell wall biosynthesis
MRWVHVTDTFLPKIGGAEIAIDQLVRAMGARGDACAVLAQRPRGMSGEIEVPYRLSRFSNPRSSRWAGWWIERHLGRLMKAFGRPDVLIGHHAFPPGYACVSYGKRHGIPTIVYPRGGDIYEVSRFRRKKHAWRKLTWALANASAVVCASEAMERIVRDIIGPSTSQRIERIPNGVDIDDLRRDAATSHFASDPAFQGPFVLGLGRTIRRKGFHLLIDAFASIANTDWRLVIAGDGRELAALQQQAQPLGDRVLFAGMVEGTDKRWLLQHCRFMAAPSIEESFGNVALEAMACGKPVLASKASGFAEIVKDRVNGRLVEVGDVPSLSDALREMMSADLTAPSTAASDTAQDFAWTSIAQRYDELARSLQSSF